jgi:hypothetical protein
MHERGRTAYRKGDHALAELCCSGAIEVGGATPAVLFDRGRSQLKQAEASADWETTPKWNGAFNDFSEANRLREGDGATLACLAYCLCRKKAYNEAIACSEQAIRSGFPEARLRNNRALCLLRSAQVNDYYDTSGRARADLNAALEREPGLWAAYCNRGLLTLKQWLKNPYQPIDLTAVADLGLAIERGPPSSALYEKAAVATAAAAAHAPLADWDRRKRQTLDYLSRAVAFGKDPKKLAKDQMLMDLISVEEFAALPVNVTPVESDKLERLLLVDPIDE